MILLYIILYNFKESSRLKRNLKSLYLDFHTKLSSFLKSFKTLRKDKKLLNTKTKLNTDLSLFFSTKTTLCTPPFSTTTDFTLKIETVV